ncbi:MAG TPA: dihydrodipicolinate synthase family protein [Mycobacteriales bacterium]|nr:dihydrodipicolinate synthase family protein [Mycobacteriales bacterium]
MTLTTDPTRQGRDQADPVIRPPIRGVSPVLEVPFTDDGTVDVDGFERVVRYVIDCGVESMMFPGYASEFLKLTESERRTLDQVLLSHTRQRDDIAAVCAVQDHSTIVATRHAAALVEAGADAINLLAPYQLGPSMTDIQEHVRAVCAAVAPVTVVLQYAPEQTGGSLTAGTIAAISRDRPNLRMVKVEVTPPGPFIHELGRQDPALPAAVGYAGVQLPDAWRRGAAGVQPGCSFTEIYMRIWRLHAAGDDSAAVDLHRRLLPYISYWMSGSELIVAAEKLISFRRGLFGSAYCRRPAHLLDSEEVAMVNRFLEEFADLLPDLHGALA